MTLSICNYKKVHICIVVAQDFQVSNSGSWEPLVLEPSWNPPLTNFWIREDWKIFFNRNIYCIFRIKLFIFIFMVFSILDWSKSEGLKYFFSPSSRSKYLFSTYSRSKYLFKKSSKPTPLKIKWSSPKPKFYLVV